MRVIDCAGAPRDLGLDQGKACASEIEAGQDEFRLRRPQALARLDRDLQRYFPHLSERTGALARGAGVSRAALVDRIGCALGFDGEPDIDLGDACCVVTRTRSGGIQLGGPALGDTPGIVRRTQPDVGFRCLEWTLPWLPYALGGINEAGLAVAVDYRGPHPAAENCSAPGVFLVQHCLERYESISGAVEWCLRRPGGGVTEILFADASGDTAGVRIDGDKRSQFSPTQSTTYAAVSAAWLVDPQRRALGVRTNAGSALHWHEL